MTGLMTWPPVLVGPVGHSQHRHSAPTLYSRESSSGQFPVSVFESVSSGNRVTVEPVHNLTTAT